MPEENLEIEEINKIFNNKKHMAALRESNMAYLNAHAPLLARYADMLGCRQLLQ